jgi:hypothetical protein
MSTIPCLCFFGDLHDALTSVCDHEDLIQAIQAARLHAERESPWRNAIPLT